ncbi:MAG: phage portal protein [Treponema sp.]|nr:phage portal protein [Treponema sp.]
MSETVQMPKKDFVKRGMFGRRKIFASAGAITPANVSKVVEQAYITHLLNRGEIEYLWRYYRGDQPSIYRERELRNELTKRICENRANSIVSFKTGYLLGKPIQYISAVDSDDVSAAVNRLNDAMRRIGKHTKDKSLVEWCMICGLGYRYVTPNNDTRIKSPFNLYTLDPRNTFVIRRNDFTEDVIAAVNYVTDEQGNITFTVFTVDRVYTFGKGQDNISSSVNAFGAIPIIEYQNNSARQGAFEIVLSLLDAINDFDCARVEAVEQFVQSLLVLYNCQVDDNVTADTIRQAGMILLKSTGGERADIKNLSEQLDQSQNQTLKDDLYNTVLQIVGVPSQGNGSTGDSSNNGAIVLKNGWQGAETRAEAFEAMFQLPEAEMLRVVAFLCDGLDDFSFDPSDIEVKFTRRNYADILSKSQTLVTMLANDKIHPKNAYEASGLFVDTEEAYRMGMSWYNRQKEEQDATEPAEQAQTVVEDVGLNAEL